MSKIIPIFTSDKTLADKLALASIHNVDYEYIDLTLFEESYSRYADHGGVVVAYLKDDEITFIEKVSSFQKK